MSPDLPQEINLENIADESALVEASMKETHDATHKEAERQGKKVFQKNKREMSRLENLAHDALHENKPESYKYAIAKLRKITLQKTLDADVLQSLWVTSKERYDQLIVETMAKIDSGELVYDENMNLVSA